MTRVYTCNSFPLVLFIQVYYTFFLNIKKDILISQNESCTDPENLARGVLDTFLVNIYHSNKGPYGPPLISNYFSRGLSTSISKETYSHLCFSEGRSGPPVPPSGSVHENNNHCCGCSLEALSMSTYNI